MRTFSLIIWTAAIILSGAGFVAVVGFGWVPSPRMVAADAFAGLFYGFGARFVLTKNDLG